MFAAKSYFGNLVLGRRPVELTASLLALQHGTLPATLNYDDPDPACPVAVHPRTAAGDEAVRAESESHATWASAPPRS